MTGKPKMHVGSKYGHLTIIADSGERNRNGSVVWLCKCDCGNVVNRSSDSIKNSMTKGCVISCNCMRDKALGKKLKDDPKRKELARKSLHQIDGTTLQSIGKQKLRKNNTSGYRGVSYSNRDGVWRARLYLRGVEYCKTFKKKEDAIKYRAHLEETLIKPIFDKAREEGII